MRAYALAEAGVGLYALAVPLVMAGYPALNAFMYRVLGGSPVGLSLARFVARGAAAAHSDDADGRDAALALPPLRRADDGSSVAGTVGRLYAINTFGAVVGTFVGGFVLLPDVGVRATNYTAAATNLMLAAAVWLAGAAGCARRSTTNCAPVDDRARRAGPADLRSHGAATHASRSSRSPSRARSP